ncbi:hypothetical protein RCC89_20860 [Cytophagaceae bacterium ABcell3]|nr:hypothetical protein RCC89_20860 [Cytophagaceae bacterium ABcell3]
MKFVTALVLLLIFGISCAPRPQQQTTDVNLDDSSQVILFTNHVTRYIHGQKWRQLLYHIHPTKGITFSPYTYIDTSTAVQMRPGGPEAFWTDTTRTLTWGYEDGTGEPIRMNFREYYEEHLYPVNFMNAEKVAFNEQIGQGNTVNNIEEVFPNAVFTEYHFAGFNPEFGGMDWRSLRVVVEAYEGNLYVVALVNDRWTI